MDIQVLKVSGSSNINAVSDSIIKHASHDGIVHIDGIGAKATYMAVKALIHVTQYMVNEGYMFNLRPYYVKVNTSEDITQTIPKTAIRWTLIAKRNIS